MIIPEVQTTEQIQVLPYTHSKPSTAFSVEQVKTILNCVIVNFFFLLAFKKSSCCGTESSSIEI